MADGATVLAADGAHLVATRHPGSGDHGVLFAHATGFCGSVWTPTAAALDVAEAVTFDFRGHGRSGRVTVPVSWWEMAADVAAVRQLISSEVVVGVGHSMGGAATVMAQLADPSRFPALVLVEPIIVPPPVRRADHSLAALARKRRAVFPSREEARANFSAKPPFSRWHPDALAGYLTDGLVDLPDGSAQLACDPAVEAELYTAAGGHGLVDLIDRVEVPTLILAGADTETYPLEWAAELARRFPQGELRVVEGTGHFLPMERPEVVAEAVRSVLS